MSNVSKKKNKYIRHMKIIIQILYRICQVIMKIINFKKIFFFLDFYEGIK